MFSSKKTKDINLIPETSVGGKAASIFPYLAIFLLVTILVAGTGAFFWWQNSSEVGKTKDIEDAIVDKNLEWQKIASSAASISLIKNKLSDYKSFSTKYPPAENYLAKVAKFLPENASLTTFDVDNVGLATFQVKAPSASEAYQLVNVLNKETTQFSSVKLLGVTRSSTAQEYTISMSMVVAK